jgi:hypothetical protein
MLKEDFCTFTTTPNPGQTHSAHPIRPHISTDLVADIDRFSLSRAVGSSQFLQMHSHFHSSRESRLRCVIVNDASPSEIGLVRQIPDSDRVTRKDHFSLLSGNGVELVFHNLP